MKKVGRYLLLFFILLGGYATTGKAEEESSLYMLSRDPFDFSAISPSGKIIEQDVSIKDTKMDFELRATLVSKQRSIANLNGIMLMQGDEIEGYTLRKIGEDDVMLEKDGNQITVSLKK